MNNNTRQQALAHFGEANAINHSIHALKFRSNDNPQIKALLPIIIPQLEARIDSFIEMAIATWERSKSTTDVTIFPSQT